MDQKINSKAEVMVLSELLKKYIESGETLIVPDAFDPLSARLIEMAGFKAVQCSGLSISISSCCEKESEITFEDNLSMTKKIVDAVNIPVMADGEDGFGGSEDVYATVQKFMQAGVSGINIEDQILSGPDEGGVIDLELMSDKIKSARQAATDYGDRHFIVNARTDVMNTITDRPEAVGAAIERANRLLDSGANMAFITYVNTVEELGKLSAAVRGPLSISAGVPYTSPEYTIRDCRELGISRVSLPTALIFSAIGGMQKTLMELWDKDDLTDLMDQDVFCSHDDLLQILSRGIR